MKFLINLDGVTYPTTHNISMLMDLAEERKVSFPAWLDDISFLLNGWATQTRCNASFIAAKRDLVRILDLIDTWVKQIECSFQSEM